MTNASRIEPITANGTLFEGLRASPARFTGLWKPLKLNTMPLVATAVNTADQPYGANELAVPKFSLWKPEVSKPRIVRPGMMNLNTVMAVFARANTFTPQ